MVRAVHAFDSSELFISATQTNDSSSLWENGFIQFRANDFGVEGLYGVAALEGRYEGTSDNTEPIYDSGLGYKSTFSSMPFDISVEYINLNKNITGTTKDEDYLIIEGTIEPMDKVTLTADWASASEIDVDTLRIEGGYKINNFVDWRIGFAQDFVGRGKDVESVDTRLTFTWF